MNINDDEENDNDDNNNDDDDDDDDDEDGNRFSLHSSSNIILQCAISGYPLSNEVPSYWTISIQAIIGNEICIGITGSINLNHAYHKYNQHNINNTTICWGMQDKLVYICGEQYSEYDNWQGDWEQNDILIFKYNPIIPRTLSFYHVRNDTTYEINNILWNEYRLYIDLCDTTSVLSIKPSSVEEIGML